MKISAKKIETPTRLRQTLPIGSPLKIEEYSLEPGERMQLRLQNEEALDYLNGQVQPITTDGLGQSLPHEFYLTGKGPTEEKALAQLTEEYHKLLREFWQKTPYSFPHNLDTIVVQSVRKDIEYTGYIDPIWGPAIFAQTICSLTFVSQARHSVSL